MIKKINDYKIIMFALCVVGIAGCLASFGYGKYLDYNSESEILWMNIKQYIIYLLGDKSRYLNHFNDYKAISESVEIDHGIALYYLISPLLLFANSSLQYDIWKIYTFIVFYIGALSLYASAKYLYKSIKVAGLLFAEIIFTPIVFSHAHYNNKDIVFMSLLNITIYFWLALMKDIGGVAKNITFMAIASAFLINCKALGGLFVAIMFGSFVIKKYFERSFSLKLLYTIVMGIILTIFLFLLITPATWKSPLDYIVYVCKYTSNFSRWEGKIKFLGNIYDAGATPWYYLPIMIIITIPIPIIIQIIVGHIFILKKDKQVKAVLIPLLIIWLVPIVYAIYNKSVLYDEWRHFFFIYGPILLISGNIIKYLEEKIPKVNILILIIVTYLVLNIGIAYPNEIAYTNAFAMNLQSEEIQLDAWGIANLQAVRALVNCENRNKDLKLTIGSANGSMEYLAIDYLRDYLQSNNQNDVYILEEGERNYLFLSTAYIGIDTTRDLTNYHELLRVGAYGNDLIIIFEKNS